MEEKIKLKNPTLHRYLFTVTTFSKFLAMFLFILLPFLGFYLGLRYQQQTTVNTSVVSDTQKTITETVADSPPKLSYKLPEGWKYVKSETPIISASPLWYSYGDVFNSSELNSPDTSLFLKNNKLFDVTILFYRNVSGIEAEGTHGGGTSVVYGKPESVVLGGKTFTKQILSPAIAGPDYEGGGYHSPDNKTYTYSYSTGTGFLVISLYFNINNPDKEKLLNDLDSFLSSIELQ